MGVCKVIAAAAVLGLIVCVSCGILSYSYVSPVTSVTSTFNSGAVISLPNSSDVITINFPTDRIPGITGANHLGSDYEIYYRIYLSDKILPTVNTDELRKDANPKLAKDWSTFYPVTVDSNNRSSEVAAMVVNMKYYSILTNSSGHLMRSNGNGAFNPVPSNRLFMTDDELFDSSNLTENINPDVAGMESGTPQYAYVSMYIVMREFNSQTLTPIYSAPSFINIFLLPSNVPVVPVTGVTLSVPTAAAPAVKLAASVTPSSATNADVEWSVSNASLAEARETPLSEEGKRAVIIAGKTAAPPVTVTVTVRTKDGGFTAKRDVSLSGIAAGGISIDNNPKTLTLIKNDTRKFTVTVLPDTALNKGVVWTSSNANVGTVSAVAGTEATVEALSAGAARITVTTTDGTELTDTCDITVTAP